MVQRLASYGTVWAALRGVMSLTEDRAAADIAVALEWPYKRTYLRAMSMVRGGYAIRTAPGRFRLTGKQPRTKRSALCG